MKPRDVKSDSYTKYKVDSNEKDPKFQVGDNVRILKYKKILLKDILLIVQKKFVLLAKLKILYFGHMSLMILMVRKLLELFMKKNDRRLIKKDLE